jgi:hypothetical protein
MAGQDDCTKRSESDEDQPENAVDLAEEGRASAMGEEANGRRQRLFM